MGGGPAVPDIEHETAAVRKVSLRILPLLFAAYFVAYIDRVNVGFAALTMNKALGLSQEQYGLAAGLFFAGYVAFAVPSNLLLARIGGRVWIPLIMLAWGIASLCNAWVRGPSSFYLVRFILGIGEAGLYPGLLYILVMWAPEKYRVRMLMLMILAGLQVLPEEQVDAARIDGAGPWQLTVHVVLPFLRGVLLVAGLFRLIDSIKAFPLIFILTDGGPGTVTEVTNYYSYIQAFNFSQLGYSSAITVILVSLTVIASAFIVRAVGWKTSGE